MNLLGRYLTKIEHEGYENFAKDTDIIVPENFNYGYDIIDEYAKLCPDKRALVWCNDKGEEKIFTFGDMKVLSDKVAYILDKSGVHKGDFVMTMLNRRYEYWITAIACHKIGAVLVPATYLLTAKDIAYRINNADVKVLIVTNEDDVTKHVAEAIPMCPSLKKVFTTTDSDLFESLDNAIDNAPEGFVPREKTTNDDKFLVYLSLIHISEPTRL